MTNGHARMPPHQSHAQHGERSAPKQFGFMLVESRSEIGDPRLHVNAWSSDAEVMLQERDTLRQPAGVQAEFDTLAPAAATGDAPAFSEGDLPVTPVAAACQRGDCVCRTSVFVAVGGRVCQRGPRCPRWLWTPESPVVVE